MFRTCHEPLHLDWCRYMWKILHHSYSIPGKGNLKFFLVLVVTVFRPLAKIYGFSKWLLTQRAHAHANSNSMHMWDHAHKHSCALCLFIMCVIIASEASVMYELAVAILWYIYIQWNLRIRDPLGCLIMSPI